MFEIEGKYGKAKIMIDGVDEETMSQIYVFLNHPAFTNPISIMPDTHYGKGAVIGFTMPITDKVIPNTIGVDLNCGVLTFNVGKDIFDNITRKELDKHIRREIPFGYKVHENEVFDINDQKFWKEVNEEVRQFTLKFNKKFNTNYSPVVFSKIHLEFCCDKIWKCDYNRVVKSIGTLGGGNHYIEVGKSENTGDYWITIHSGSRNLGLSIAKYWQNIAKRNLDNGIRVDFEREVKKVLKDCKKSDIRKELDALKEKYKDKNVAKGLEYLENKDMFGYLVDVIFAQKYAKKNREVMAQIIIDGLNVDVKETIESVHNYIDFNDFIIRKGAISSYKIRKGAISSYKDQKILIPFNQEDGMLICEGKSNKEWNYSAPHGAGRVGSRTWAKKNLSKQDARKRMDKKGIYCSLLPLDETRDAYKKASIIEEAIGPTAKILDRIIPVLNLKDGKKKDK